MVLVASLVSDQYSSVVHLYSEEIKTGDIDSLLLVFAAARGRGVKRFRGLPSLM